MTDFDPNLTAYALGEMDGVSRADVENYLSTHPAARQFVEETRATAARLTEGLHAEASPGLGEDRLAALLGQADLTPAPALRLHEEDPAADEFSDDPHGTPLYHVITHPAAGPRHWRWTLVAVAAAVAIVASVLTAGLSSLVRGPRDPRPTATTPEPLPAPLVFQFPDRNTGAEGPDQAVLFPAQLVAKTPQDLLPLPDRSHDPVFGVGPVLVTRLQDPAPTTRQSTPAGGGYAIAVENPFFDVTQSPLSALPLHAGRASYAAVKKAIESGRWPTKDVVRVEELVNFFPYDYAAPNRGEVFAARLETAACPWDATHRLVRIGVKAKAGGADEIVARAATMRVEFNPAGVAAYRLIGFDRHLSTRSPESGGSDGDVVAGHAVTALYELIPATASAAAARPSLKYQSAAGLTEAGKSGELLTVTLRYQDAAGARRDQAFAARDTGSDYPAASADFQFAAATAAFGMVLRDSPHKGVATLDTVLALATPGLTSDELGVRAEFVELVKKAKAIKA